MTASTSNHISEIITKEELGSITDSGEVQLSSLNAESATNKDVQLELEQPFYVYDPSAGWIVSLQNSGFSGSSEIPSNANSTSAKAANQSQASNPTQIAPALSFTLVTWNVDFMASHESTRLATIIDYIQHSLVNPLPSHSESTTHVRAPPVLLLQEVHHSCFPALLEHPLIRTTYAVTDISSATWSEPDAAYGLITLVPRILIPAVHRVFRTPFESAMARDALYVEITVDSPSSGRILRVANTHLESLREGDSLRPVQLTSVARQFEGVHAGIVGGDMNPIGPLDQKLPGRLGLSDAWLIQQAKNPHLSADEAKGKVSKMRDGDDNDVFMDTEGGDGYTWGTQPTSRFPKRRMDKILFTGGVAVDQIERIGIGLKASVIRRDGRRYQLWASDHFGLVAQVTISERQ
ncbi:hypothetical protein HYPSUDRAFT_39729 [Hypholoma sublateritium FD-334 SS-4]|uniref:Endonuclease/exonuclease/phosphatase domain-containing protein n=1 Tax=Hypholoma sublateritium (strain FD-334 SS-4) TaxID=945553 RepID=A0A0D2L8J8_HYPSF|nr:hypothetical protein HYPSUDRAFT_39729 [Hypholoma sublateritium FD-334 SS-4]